MDIAHLFGFMHFLSISTLKGQELQKKRIGMPRNGQRLGMPRNGQRLGMPMIVQNNRFLNGMARNGKEWL